ncbi:hypothetical protein M231_06797 [Tremella mesenterica]|uniref:Uncharacterized protein n=1 Tax=Tremella mesenterica TaxID=5217 RepID=A0A4Q1BG06_TREME|nr:hypothetical protein M231_06797 [Tremella mesenterica]
MSSVLDDQLRQYQSPVEDNRLEVSVVLLRAAALALLLTVKLASTFEENGVVTNLNSDTLPLIDKVRTLCIPGRIRTVSSEDDLEQSRLEEQYLPDSQSPVESHLTEKACRCLRYLPTVGASADSFLEHVVQAGDTSPASEVPMTKFRQQIQRLEGLLDRSLKSHAWPNGDFGSDSATPDLMSDVCPSVGANSVDEALVSGPSILPVAVGEPGSDQGAPSGHDIGEDTVTR